MTAPRMALALAGLMAAATGCAAEEDWIVRPPGGGGTGGGGSGGGSGDAGTGASERGRLCVVSDLRTPYQCPSTGDAAGAQVHVVGGGTATTDAAGRFTLAVPSGPQVIEIGGTATLVAATVAVDVDGSALALPVPLASSYQAVLDAVPATRITGAGDVVLHVEEADGSPMRGLSFESVPGAAFPPVYDDGAATQWRFDGGTGAAGVVLMVGVPEGTYAIISGDVSVRGVVVRRDAVTFARASLR